MLFFVLRLDLESSKISTFFKDYKEEFGHSLESIFTYVMRSSYGGINYRDIMNMGFDEIGKYQNELSKIINKENKANKNG